MPDVFVPEDTTNFTSYYKEAIMSGLMLQYAFAFTDQNRPTLAKYTDVKSLAAYLKKQGLVDKFVNYAEANGIKRRNLMIRKSHSLLEQFLESRIIYNILDEQAWNEYINEDDPTIKAALNVFKTGNFPKKPNTGNGPTAMNSPFFMNIWGTDARYFGTNIMAIGDRKQNSITL